MLGTHHNTDMHATTETYESVHIYSLSNTPTYKKGVFLVPELDRIKKKTQTKPKHKTVNSASMHFTMFSIVPLVPLPAAG